MAEDKVAGFNVFLFLKGKNIAAPSEKQRKEQVKSMWEALTEEQRGKYAKIAEECLDTTNSDSTEESEASNWLSLLKQAIRRSLLSCSRYLRSCNEGRKSPMLCPVNLLHEDILTCPVCSLAYDLAVRMPVCLPCGHTLCGDCVRVMGERETLRCPFDRSAVESLSTSLRANLALCDAVAKASDWAQCRSHGFQVIAFCEKDRSFLCGLCVQEHPHDCAVALDSKEALRIAEEKAAKGVEKLNAANYTLQCIYASVAHLRLTSDSLLSKCSPAASVHSATNKQLLRKLKKLQSSLCACANALQTALVRGYQQVGAQGKLAVWQRLVQEEVEVPVSGPKTEDVISCLGQWLSYI